MSLFAEGLLPYNWVSSRLRLSFSASVIGSMVQNSKSPSAYRFALAGANGGIGCFVGALRSNFHRPFSMTYTSLLYCPRAVVLSRYRLNVFCFPTCSMTPMDVFFLSSPLEEIALAAALPPTVVAMFVTIIICFGSDMDRLYAFAEMTATRAQFSYRRKARE